MCPITSCDEFRSQVALRVHGRQEPVVGKILLDMIGVQAGLAGGDLHARRVGQVVLEGGREVGAHPDGASAGTGRIEAFRHIDAPNLERLGQVLDQRREEGGARGGGGAIDDGAQQFFRPALLRAAIANALSFTQDPSHACCHPAAMLPPPDSLAAGAFSVHGSCRHRCERPGRVRHGANA
jgi:hypothetical protein